jgi:hypothetical protein
VKELDTNSPDTPATLRLPNANGRANGEHCEPDDAGMADAGRMPAPLKLGALVRWNRASIDAWIEQGCKPIRTFGAKGGGA